MRDRNDACFLKKLLLQLKKRDRNDACFFKRLLLPLKMRDRNDACFFKRLLHPAKAGFSMMLFIEGIASSQKCSSQ
jgi:hypothetical protein